MHAITPRVKPTIAGIVALAIKNTTPQLRETMPMVNEVYLIIFVFLLIEFRFLHYQYGVAYHAPILVSKNYHQFPLLRQ